MVVGLSEYRRIGHQELPDLSNVNEDNFDKAFEFCKPGLCRCLSEILCLKIDDKTVTRGITMGGRQRGHSSGHYCKDSRCAGRPLNRKGLGPK